MLFEIEVDFSYVFLKRWCDLFADHLDVPEEDSNPAPRFIPIKLADASSPFWSGRLGTLQVERRAHALIQGRRLMQSGCLPVQPHPPSAHRVRIY